MVAAGDETHGDAQVGRTALIGASGWGREGCVRLLVEAGADRSLKDKSGDTALSCAATEAIKAILRG